MLRRFREIAYDEPLNVQMNFEIVLFIFFCFWICVKDPHNPSFTLDIIREVINAALFSKLFN